MNQSSFLICNSLILLLASFAFSDSVKGDVPNKDDEPNTKSRDGRWLDKDESGMSVQLGYYLPSNPQDYSNDDDNSADDQFRLPTSFDDFKPGPGPTQSKKSSVPVGGSFKGQQMPSNWKGFSNDYDFPGSWSPLPSDVTAMITALQDAQNKKPAGFLDKLTSQPIFAVAALIPIALLLAAVLPSIFSFFLHGNMGIPTVATTATGNNGKIQRSSDPSMVSIIVKAIEKFESENLYEPACLRQTICNAIKNNQSVDFKTIQRSIYKAFTLFDDYWIAKFGMKELMDAVVRGNCESFNCSKAKSNSVTVGDKKKNV